MRLTGFSKFLIVLAIVGVVAFGLIKLRDSGLLGNITPAKDKTEQTDEPATTGDNKADDPKPEQKKTEKGVNNAVSSFNYAPAEPKNGKLKGVVELGASGFNSFVVRIDAEKNWKLEKAEFGSSLVNEGLTSGKDVKETLKNYIGGIVNYGVATRDIHFVVSSGAVNSEKVPDIIRGLKQMGYVVNTVDAIKEGKLALSCVLPTSYYDGAFVVDIGSGNTKISWATGTDLASAKSVEASGAKYFQKGVTDEKVFAEVQAAANQVPKTKRDVCFIIGGVPFELAKKIRQGKERYTVLKAPKDYTPDGEKQKAGLNIYRAIAEQTKCETFVFDWDANFTIGFLLGLK